MVHLTARDFQMEVIESGLPVVVMFYAVWCGKCAMMQPIIEELDEKYRGRILFYMVEIEESPALAAEYSANIVPTFVLFHHGRRVGTLRGLINRRVFEQRIQKIFRNS